MPASAFDVELACGCVKMYEHTRPRPGDELLCRHHGPTRAVGAPLRATPNVTQADQRGRCAGTCGRMLITDRRLRDIGQEEVVGLRRAGFVRHAGKGLCSRCYVRQTRGIDRG